MSDATELQASIERTLEELCARTDDATSCEEFKKFLRAAARFHHYSFGNALLIASQRPTATNVAGFQTWKSLGRFVRKGERGIRILAPLVVKDKEDPTRRRLCGFRSVAVFDVGQTDGEPLPSIETNAVTGGEALLPMLEALVRSLGIKLTYAALNGPEGLSAGGAISIEENLDVPARCGVIVHELAHELLHKSKESRAGATKQQRELEAEAVSFMVLTQYGLEPKSEFYLASYGINAAMLKESAAIISHATQRIMQLLDPNRSAKEGVEAMVDSSEQDALAATPLHLAVAGPHTLLAA